MPVSPVKARASWREPPATAAALTGELRHAPQSRAGNFACTSKGMLTCSALQVGRARSLMPRCTGYCNGSATGGHCSSRSREPGLG